jgi:hypothetical protein
MARDIRYYIMVWILARDTPIFFTKKTDRHDATVILLKAVLNQTNPNPIFLFCKWNVFGFGLFLYFYWVFCCKSLQIHIETT